MSLASNAKMTGARHAVRIMVHILCFIACMHTVKRISSFVIL